jgi:Lrp/AsnC family transcriptional regulator for asnA, asnC and gidA
MKMEHPARLGETERQIVLLLQEDGRMSTSEMARRIGVSEPTVRRKLTFLLDSGTVQIRAVSNPVSLGFEASAIIGVDVKRDYIGHVAEVLKQFSFVESVAVTTGPYDLMIQACFKNLRELYDFILVELASVEGIEDSHSFMILKHEKYGGPVGVAKRDGGSNSEPADNVGDD